MTLRTHPRSFGLLAALAGLFLAWVAGAAGVAHGQARDKGLTAAGTTAEELADALAPRRVALVIGINEYDDPVFGDLAHAVADAEAVADQLVAGTGGGFDRVVRLTGSGNGSRGRILSELKLLRRSVHREDVVVVYFSGHGTLVVRPDGSLSPFLLAADSRSGELLTTALDVAAVQRFFAAIPAQRKALIVDACFNGDGKSALGPEAAKAAQTLEPDASMTDLTRVGSGEALLFATTLGRPAREDDELGHGTYTYYLLESLSWDSGRADLNLDGLVTAYEAHDWARRRVYERTAGIQIPEAAFRVVGVHDVVLAGDPSQRRASDRALVFAYLPAGHPYHGAKLLVDGRDKGVLPGTIVTDSGRHQFTVLDADGAVLFEGSATVSQGQSLAVDDLRALVREDRLQVAVHLGYLGGNPDVWGPVLGGGMATMEIWMGGRRAGPRAKGMFVGGALGMGVSPSRILGEGRIEDTRTAWWVAPQVGWSKDLRRLRVRLALELRATVLPTDRIGLAGEGEITPWEAGWFFLSGGPSLRMGVVVTDRMAVVAGGDLQLVYLDVDGDGKAHVNPLGGFMLGVEIGI